MVSISLFHGKRVVCLPKRMNSYLNAYINSMLHTNATIPQSNLIISLIHFHPHCCGFSLGMLFVIVMRACVKSIGFFFGFFHCLCILLHFVWGSFILKNRVTLHTPWSYVVQGFHTVLFLLCLKITIITNTIYNMIFLLFAIKYL